MEAMLKVRYSGIEGLQIDLHDMRFRSEETEHAFSYSILNKVGLSNRWIFKPMNLSQSMTILTILRWLYTAYKCITLQTNFCKKKPRFYARTSNVGSSLTFQRNVKLRCKLQNYTSNCKIQTIWFRQRKDCASPLRISYFEEYLLIFYAYILSLQS